MAEPVSDPKLAEAVRVLREYEEGTGTPFAGCIHTVLDALEEAERGHRPGCDEALCEVQIERDKAEAALREAQETCHDRNHVGLRKFITGLGDVPSERGQDIAFLALKFEQALREAQEENETSARVIQDLNKAWDIRERQASEKENQLRARALSLCGFIREHSDKLPWFQIRDYVMATEREARAALSPIPADVLKSRG